MRFHSLSLAAALCGLYTTAEAQTPPTPVPPVANAGAFQTTEAGSWVGLDGRQSHNPGGGALTFQWTQTGGPSVVLYDADKPTAYFRTDPGIAPATYIIRLRVTNAMGQQDGSGLKVTVTPDIVEFTGNKDSLAPYSAFGSLTTREAQHLARRVAYDMSPAEIETIRQDGLIPTVQTLMNTSTPTSVRFDALDFFGQGNQCVRVYFGNQEENQNYLFHLFLRDRTNVLMWRMFYFWHDRFATSTRDLRIPIQNHRFEHMTLIEEHALDPAKSHYDFLEALTTDGAMMEWLNVRDSLASMPNENFMRELMELFVIGLDEVIPMTPNFSEQDVQNGSKVLTGWYTDVGQFICTGSNGTNRLGGISRFDPANHDPGPYTLFPNHHAPMVTDVRSVVEACLDHPAAPRYAATNLFEYFVGFEPHVTVVDELAMDIVNDAWNLQPTIEKILVSQAMFSPEARKAKIATPLDFCLGAVRKFDFPFETETFRLRLQAMGHHLLEPPSVKGWPSDESWIGQQAMVDRMTFINEMLMNATDGANLPDLPTKLAPFLPSDPNLNDAASYVQSLFRALDIDRDELNSSLFTRLMEYMNTDHATGVEDRFDASLLPHLRDRGTGAIYHGYTLSIGINY